MNTKRHRPLWITGSLFAAALIVGSIRDPDFWRTANLRGDALMKAGEFTAAAKVYQDPWRIGMAQYRAGDFKAAAVTFARVPGAVGAFNAGNARLMGGSYDAAIAAYDRALGFRAGWPDAQDNKALAIARRDSMKVSDKEREEESADAYDPDEIVSDARKNPSSDQQNDTPDQAAMSDKELQATWLRRVKTTPGQFLKAKFASQDQASATTIDEPE